MLLFTLGLFAGVLLTLGYYKHAKRSRKRISKPWIRQQQVRSYMPKVETKQVGAMATPSHDPITGRSLTYAWKRSPSP